MSYILKSGEKPDVTFMSAKEKFNLLPPNRRIEIISKMPDEDAARLEYDWDWNGRPKQLSPDNAKSRATSFCMCRYLEAQSKTKEKLKLENFPSCDSVTTYETLTVYENPNDSSWIGMIKNGSSGYIKSPDQNLADFWMRTVVHDEPKVCQFRKLWSTWVLLAGRGFGKTRVGAEFVQTAVEHGIAKRIHIISPTSADARDVAVEGESGILNIAPPWNKPLYESTKRRLTWPNGATATLFSAEEAERLRGPQCDLLWCFVKDTMIETEHGPKPIQDVRVGDRVWTRKGLRRVYDARMTGIRPVMTLSTTHGTTLTGTPNHRIWVDTQGWLELQSIPVGGRLYSFEEYKLCESYTTESRTVQNSADILRTETELPFTELFTKSTLAQFLKDSISTIRTKISTTTTQVTSKLFPDLSIFDRTSYEGVLQRGLTRRKSTRTSSGLRIQGEKFLARTAELFSIRSTNEHDGAQENAEPKGERKDWSTRLRNRLERVSARSAKSNSKLMLSDPTVRQSATQNDTSTPMIVLSVEPCSPQPTHSTHAPKSANTSSKSLFGRPMDICGSSGCQSTDKNGSMQEREVWNLSVEDEHEYFANGLLVKNCDELAAWDQNEQQMVWDMAMFGLRLGKNPRAVVTTTPKPTILIQNLVSMAKNPENRVIITTGSTYENKTNLAAPFMRQITQYEGTNLGRQEIYAELIDIEESGIVKRSWFKKWPANRPLPMIDFVIQSYDTAFTQQTENDPTGCLALGVFRPGPDEPHAIILLDAWKDHLKYPELRKKAIDEFKCTYGDQEARVDMLLIEDKGSGISLIQDLQRAGLPIRKYNPGRPDKVMRLHAISHLIYNGRVYIPESKKVPGEFVSWAEDFLREVCAFPNSAHDEYVDCISQALAVFRDQEWISVDPEPEKNPYEDEERELYEEEYSNPYMA